MPNRPFMDFGGQMRLRMLLPFFLIATACSGSQQSESTPATRVFAVVPGAANASARLAESPRHGEWVMVRTSPTDSVRAWIVYPERKTKAPVVVVIQEIMGVSNWIRAVTDQLAAQGFIAIAPDPMTKFNIP